MFSLLIADCCPLYNASMTDITAVNVGDHVAVVGGKYKGRTAVVVRDAVDELRVIRAHVDELIVLMEKVNFSK